MATLFIQGLYCFSKRNFPDPDDEVLECLLDQCFSHFNVHMNHQKILLKHRLSFRGTGLGPGILHVWYPSVDRRSLTWPNPALPATLWSRRAFCVWFLTCVTAGKRQMWQFPHLYLSTRSSNEKPSSHYNFVADGMSSPLAHFSDVPKMLMHPQPVSHTTAR